MSLFDQFPSLRDLPVKSAPPDLAVKLRVLASREIARRNLRSARWIDHLRLLAENGMRPMALPVVGGVFSAVILFSMFLPPVYPLRPLNSADIPTMLTTTAILKGTDCDMHRRGDASPLARFFRFSFGPLSPASFDDDIAILRRALQR